MKIENTIKIVTALMLFISFNGHTQTNEIISEDIKIGAVEKVPVYPGCNGNNEELEQCLSENIRKFVFKNFRMRKILDLNPPPGRYKLLINFKILTSGKIEIIDVQPHHKTLKKEAIRTVNKMPLIKAGEQFGELVNVISSMYMFCNVTRHDY